MFEYSLEYLFSYVCTVEKPQLIGPIPEKGFAPSSTSPRAK